MKLTISIEVMHHQEFQRNTISILKTRYNWYDRIRYSSFARHYVNNHNEHNPTVKNPTRQLSDTGGWQPKASIIQQWPIPVKKVNYPTNI